MTSNGLRGVTKTTKATKVTKKTTLVFLVGFVTLVSFVSERGPWAAFQQEQKPTEAQQRPVFRGGAYFVTVDVYPTLNGRILTDLTEADFEVLEDGKPQKIESFELVQIAAATAEQARGSELIMKSAEKMRTITQHVERSSQEQARGGRQMTSSIEQISAMVNNLNTSQRNWSHKGE